MRACVGVGTLSSARLESSTHAPSASPARPLARTSKLSPTCGFTKRNAVSGRCRASAFPVVENTPRSGLLPLFKDFLAARRVFFQSPLSARITSPRKADETPSKKRRSRQHSTHRNALHGMLSTSPPPRRAY